MSRNAYEIRFDTLCLARDILSENRHLKIEALTNLANLAGRPPQEVIAEAKLPHYTTEEVLAEAERLYAFVAPDQAAPASKLPGDTP